MKSPFEEKVSYIIRVIFFNVIIRGSNSSTIYLNFHCSANIP